MAWSAMAGSEPVPLPTRPGHIALCSLGKGFMASRRLVCRPQEIVTEATDLVVTGRQIAPDPRRRRDLGHGASEGFDDVPPVVAVPLEGGERLRPGNMSLARRAAVVLGEMDVVDGADRRVDRVDGRFSSMLRWKVS